MVWVIFGVNNKDIWMSFSLVDFKQVIVCWDVIKSLLNDCWSILKMFCVKCCPHLCSFYWLNALMNNPFLNKNASNIKTRNTTKLVGKPLNVFFLICWKFVDVVNFNRLPYNFVDEKKMKPRCSIHSSPFISPWFLSFVVSVFSYV